MSEMKSLSAQSPLKRLAIWAVAFVLLAAGALAGASAVLVLKQLPVGQALADKTAWLFATNSAQITWFITRSAGWVAYLLLWFSTFWGLALPTKFFERFLSPSFTFDFHEFISLLALGFVLLHIGVLLFDTYLPYSLAQILVPFLSPYRPVWVGLGVLSFYLSLLVTITFYLRKRIGQKRFKDIHTLSLVAYFGTVLHAFFAGTDSSLSAAQLVYYMTFLPVVFLTAYWLLNGLRHNKEAKPIQKATRYAHTRTPARH